MAKNKYYNNVEKMYVPKNIETSDVKKRSYWNSDKNGGAIIALIFAYVIVIMLLMQMMTNGGVPVRTEVIVVVVVTVIYLIGPVQLIVRKVVIQEPRLREIVRDIETNRVSTVEAFAGVESVGYKGEQTNGLMNYQRDLFGNKKGVIVGFDKSSIIGIHAGAFNSYREVKQEFYRGLHNLGMDIMPFDLKRSPSVSPQLSHERELLRGMAEEDPIRAEYHAMQLQAKMAQELSPSARYMEYILITKQDFKIAFKMKELINQVIEEKLAVSSYIVDPHILDYQEIESLTNDYYKVTGVRLENIRKVGEVADFEELVEITGYFDIDNQRMSREAFLKRVEDYETVSALKTEVEMEEERLKESEKRQQQLMDEFLLGLMEDRKNKKITVDEYNYYVGLLESEMLMNGLEDVKYSKQIRKFKEQYAEHLAEEGIVDEKEQARLDKEAKKEAEKLEKQKAEKSKIKKDQEVIDLGFDNKPKEEQLIDIFQEDDKGE